MSTEATTPGQVKACSRCGYPGTADDPLPSSGVCFDCQDKNEIL